MQQFIVFARLSTPIIVIDNQHSHFIKKLSVKANFYKDCHTVMKFNKEKSRRVLLRVKYTALREKGLVLYIWRPDTTAEPFKRLNIRRSYMEIWNGTQITIL